MSGGGLATVAGEPAAVRAAAAVLRRRAGCLREEAASVAGQPCSAWAGAAATSFTGLVLALPADIRGSAEAAASLADALDTYAGALSAAQAALPGLRSRVAEAERRLARAEATRTGGNLLGAADPAAVRAVQEADAAVRELHALRREAERLASTVEDAGRAAARVADVARERLPDGRSLAAHAGNGAVEVAAAAGQDVAAFAREHADTMQAAADVLAVVGLVAMAGAVVCPPLAAVAGGSRLAQAALVGARVAATGSRVATWGGAAANSGAVAGADKEVEDLWPDALAVGTLGLSRALTAPSRLVPGPAGRWNVATARAADRQLPSMAGWTSPRTWTVPAGANPGAVPSVWAAGATLGSNELVMRSVQIAVTAPAASVGLYGGVVAAGALGRRASEGRGGAPVRAQTRPAAPRPPAGPRPSEGPRLPAAPRPPGGRDS